MMKKWIRAVSSAVLLEKKSFLCFFRVFLFLSLLARIFLLCHVTDDDFLHNDGKEYQDISRQIYLGNGYSIQTHRWYNIVRPGTENQPHPEITRPPVFPLLGAMLYFLPWDWMISAKTVSFLLSALAIYAVYLLSKSVSRTGPAKLAALIFAWYPFSLYYTVSWSTETLFLLLIVLSFHALLKAFREHVKWYLPAACLLASAILTRPTGAILVPVYGILILIHLHQNLRDWKKILKYGSTALLLFALILLPWTIRNYRIGGKFTPLGYYDAFIFFQTNSDVIYETYRNMDQPDYEKKLDPVYRKMTTEAASYFHRHQIYSPLEQLKTYRKWGWEYIHRHPERVIYITANRMVHYFRMCPNLASLTPRQICLLRLFFSGFFFFTVIGIAARRRIFTDMMLLFPVAGGCLAAMPYHFVLRYRYPFFAPFLCIFAVWGILRILRICGRKKILPGNTVH